MGSDNVFGVEPPKDANGEVIPLDADALYDKYENVFHVVGFRYSPKESEWFVFGGFTGPKESWRFETNRLFLAPPDSWEKLEEDAKKSVCDYADAPHDEDGLITCDGCRFHESLPCYEGMAHDVLKRAKRLAGVE